VFLGFLRFGEEKVVWIFFGNNKGIIRYLRPLVEPAVIKGKTQKQIFSKTLMFSWDTQHKNIWIHWALLRMVCRRLHEPTKHSTRQASAHSSSICWSPQDCVRRFSSSSITAWKSRLSRIFCDNMRRDAAHT